MNDDEREDGAIARALGMEVGPAGPDPDADEYREVLSRLSDDVAPPAHLEHQVVGAALARRPASALSSRRRRRGQLAVVSAALAVAAAVVVALLIAHSGSTTKPTGRVEPIARSRADIAALAARPGARSGVFTNNLGEVVLAADGTGYVYDLTRADSVAVWVDSAGGTTRLGAATPQNGVVGFTVDKPGRARVVRLTTPEGAELGRAALTTG